MALAPEDGQINSDEADLTMPDEPVINTDNTSVVVHKQAKNYDTAAPIVTDLSDNLGDDYDGIRVPVLPDTASRVNDDMESTKIGIDVSEDSVSWYNTLVSSFASHPSKGIFEDALADPNAEWRNALAFGGKVINIGRPKFTNKGRGGRMSSERLQLSVRAKLGMGSPIQTPLPASGFYATIKPLEEIEIIALWREIVAETVKLGRQTHGLLFSNNQVFTAKAIYQAWLGSLVETTVSNLPNENLIDHITINDMPIISHSIATSLYPNGFPMTRSIFAGDSKVPEKEINQIIDVRKSLFMNAKAFTEAQLGHMVKRLEQPMTLQSVKDYRDQFAFSQNTVVDIGEGIKLHLHTPSLREYFESGEKWINEITATVRKALGADAEDNARLPYLSQLAKASRLRQYAHYVSAIEEDGEMYNTRENVDKTLNSLSASDKISKLVYKAISDYINNTQVSLIATTSVNEYEDTLTGNKWPRLIPIDAISVFFQLVEQRLRGITSRALEDTSD